jgi:hypothetical protein
MNEENVIDQKMRLPFQVMCNRLNWCGGAVL